MRNLILAAWPDKYYVELKDTAFEYDNVEPKDLLDHILTNYATMDESEIEVGTFVDGLEGVFNFGFIHGGVVGGYVVEEVFGLNVVVLEGGVL